MQLNLRLHSMNAAAPAARRTRSAVRKGRKWLWALVRAVFIIGFSFVVLYPLLKIISQSFMERRDLYDASVLWLPKHFTLENYAYTIEWMDYVPSFLNSLWSSTLATLLQLFSCVTAGYAFARYRFPFHRILFGAVIVMLIIPPQLTMMASYMQFYDFDVAHILHLINGKGINLLDSQWPIMLMSATGTGIRSGLFIYMFRQFFRSMPRETEEAAMVDGAGHFRIFFTIMLPGATTVLVTVALFSFVWQWNDVFFTNLYNRTFQNLTMQTQMIASNFVDTLDPAVAQLHRSVALLLTIAPLVLLFLVMQRFFVESVERSGVVG